jgi:hypothetical protein
LWIYYGMLISSPPVIIWNVIALFVGFLTVERVSLSVTQQSLGAPLNRKQAGEGAER